MKKTLLSVAMVASLMSLSQVVSAQISVGGVPLSVSNGLTAIQPTVNTYANPLNSEEAVDAVRDLGDRDNRMYVAKAVETDLKFPESGTFHYLDNGQIVWKAQLEIVGAPAVGLYLDRFDLPKGVNMFVYNANASQMLGAYTIENVSPEDKLFAIQPVQGNYVNIELNIEPFVNMNMIEMSINRAAVYFEGISYLEQYRNDKEGVLVGVDRFGLEGQGAPCMIDAACETGDYDVARRASIQTLYLNTRGNLVSMCSASMINSLGNTPTNCKNYVLTASHCQSNSTTALGDTVNSAFSQMLFRYNFEKTECNSNLKAQVDVISSANFVARSDYDGNSSSINDDFLLLELRIRVPKSYNSVLAGWDANANQTVNYGVNGDKKFIGFHHPSGDIKKVASKYVISRRGSHYTINLNTDGSDGAVYKGTSGSSLFNNDSRIIGIASTASGGITNCEPTFSSLNYYNIPTAYEHDINTPTKNLKTWLDPYNTGRLQADWQGTHCDEGDGVTSIKTASVLDNAINIYPNPTQDGILNVKFDLEDVQNITLDVYNIMGAKVGALQVKNINRGTYTLDLSSLNSGIYMVKCSNGTEVITKKITIAK